MTYRPYAAIIAEAAAQNTNLQTDLTNNSGSDIAALQPVASVPGDGEIEAIDVTSQDSYLSALGLAVAAIPNGSDGNVITHGRLPNVTTSFNFGDYLYVGSDGNLTNLPPDIGSNGFVAGDFIIRMGIVVRNKVTPSQKDFLVQVERVGQL
jgi:hypothetical protein